VTATTAATTTAADARTVVPMDARLVARAVAGDRRATEEIVRLHSARVLRVCRSVLRDRYDADDAAQETWTRALRALPRFRGDDLGAWLGTIARNESLRLIAARNRGPVPVAELPPVSDRDGDPYQAARAAEVGAALHAAVVALPVTYREAAVRDLAGESPARIAEVLELSPVAARVRTHRARRAVQTRLATALAA